MLPENQQGGHSRLVEIIQQLVHLQKQELLAWHGLEVGVQAVDADELRAVLFNRKPCAASKFAGR